MTGQTNPLDVVSTPRIWFRGVSDNLEKKFTFVDKAYVLPNVLSAWTNSPVIAVKFAKTAIIQGIFPSGTRYLYSGTAHKENEHILPGGNFRLIQRVVGQVRSLADAVLGPTHLPLFIIEYLPGK